MQVSHLSDLKSERLTIERRDSRFVKGLARYLAACTSLVRVERLMRTMNLPELPIQTASPDECVKIYLQRLLAADAVLASWPSIILTAYLTWPNDAERRNSFVATYLVRLSNPSDDKTSTPLELFGGIGAVANPAFDQLTAEISQVQRKWLLTADIFQLTVDMAFDQRIALRRGSSISKAIDLCEVERGLPGHSQLRSAWSEFRDVAHLLAASAYLAHFGLAQDISADEASILKAIWIAPDAVLALACGLQDFGLQPKSIRKESPILNPEKLWRIPATHKPEKPFIIFRRLTEAQLIFLNSRRAAKKVA